MAWDLPISPVYTSEPAGKSNRCCTKQVRVRPTCVNLESSSQGWKPVCCDRLTNSFNLQDSKRDIRSPKTLMTCSVRSFFMISSKVFRKCNLFPALPLALSQPCNVQGCVLRTIRHTVCHRCFAADFHFVSFGVWRKGKVRVRRKYVSGFGREYLLYQEHSPATDVKQIRDLKWRWFGALRLMLSSPCRSSVIR